MLVPPEPGSCSTSRKRVQGVYRRVVYPYGQWLLVGRPVRITDQIDTIYYLVLRAIVKEEKGDGIELTFRVEGLDIKAGPSDSTG